jgi:hypothetical protein
MGDKFVAQIRLGQQTCRPAVNFNVTKMQEENIIAQLVFIKENKFSFYFRNTSFFVWTRKNSSIPVTLKIILGRQTCRPAQTRVTNLSA